MAVIRIALSGKMRSGKDTVADYLVKRHGFTRMAFADKLKDVVRDLFEVRESSKNRHLLQQVGRHMCQVDPAVWVKYVVNRIPLDRDIVVSDLRFPEEYHTLRGLGFILVRLDASLQTQLERLGRTEPETWTVLMADQSETALDEGYKWNYMLDANCDMGVLMIRTDTIVADILSGGKGN